MIDDAETVINAFRNGTTYQIKKAAEAIRLAMMQEELRRLQ
jgi:hypothetical protein